jgi:hypothetical protein
MYALSASNPAFRTKKKEVGYNWTIKKLRHIE